MTKEKRNLLLTILAAVALAVIAVCFFAPDAIEGRVLQQHDIRQGIANGHETQLYEAETGEASRWTQSLFSGMPTFQISPSYSANRMLGVLQTIFGLGLPSPANLLFMLMAGFFIMCLCMKMRWPLALFASIAWGFSTYFIIIIGAGHIWKFVTLAYIPPTIGGIVLLYRGKYLGGAALTSLFASMQLMSNHPQMTYYFLTVIVCLVTAFGVICYREKKGKRFWTATGLAALCAILALCVNSASLYNSYEYSKETVRGRSTLLTAAETDTDVAVGAADKKGMDRDAITAWSYGIDETLSLLIPNVKGGATIKPTGAENSFLSVSDTDTAQESYLSPQEMQVLSQFPQYFGDQPMTNGPVYVGAIVLLLAILGLFVAEGPKLGPIKWALFAASALSIMLAWGHNFSFLTDLFIDYVPGYNKFRAVASILVVLEFCVPLLAAMALYRMVTMPDFFKVYKWTLYCVFGVGALICFTGWVSPSVFGSPFSVSEAEQLGAMGILNDPAYANLLSTLRRARLDMVSADSLRSLMYILLGFGVIMLYLKRAFKSPTLFICCLTAICLIDLFSVNKRYVNSDNFAEPQTENTGGFEPTEADRYILEDKSLNYRVADLGDMGGARSSYFHHTIGGYHAAKLTRYNDLLNRAIMPAAERLRQTASENAKLSQDSSAQAPALLFSRDEPVMDMLNARYYMIGSYAEQNPNALGNAWFVDRVNYVTGADAEMNTLLKIDPRTMAVADESMRAILGNAVMPTPGDTVTETSYAPNRLTYKAKSANGGVVVFSEVYFPWGWSATIDGKPAEIARVNYTLRAMRVPAGEHEITMTFDPKSLAVTNGLGVAGSIVIYLLLIGALAAAVAKKYVRKN